MEINYTLETIRQSLEVFMADLLPEIDIAILDDPRVFMNRIAKVCADLGTFDIEKHFGCLGDPEFDIVNFRYKGRSQHVDLGGQLIRRPASTARVAVEMRAARWDPDPPTRDAYVASARLVFGPALTAYNRRYGRRYRFRVWNAQYGPKPSKRTLMLLDRFSVIANQSSLHPLDWRRFYEFVRDSRQELRFEVLESLLIERGFSKGKANQLAEVYAHLWAYKRLSR